MANPFTEFDTNIDGKEFSEGVVGIGELYWSNENQRWWGLVNYFGMLATAEFRVTAGARHPTP